MTRTPVKGLALCLAAATAFGCARLQPAAEAPQAQARPAIARADVRSPVKPKVTTLGEAPASALLIGNSFFYYNNSLHSHLGQLVRQADPKPVERLRSTSVTISGSGIDWHDVESYFRPDAVGSYSFDGRNNVVFNKLDKLFDVAIVMDCSQCPIHPKLKPVFHEHAKKDIAIMRKHGAQPALFMSWAYEDVPEMTAQLAEQYTLAGNANDALVIPAGLAFAKALHRRPDLELYVADKRHPTLAGTYLAACTVYASLYGRTPEGNKYAAGLDAATARFLQSVAWETAREYYQ